VFIQDKAKDAVLVTGAETRAVSFDKLLLLTITLVIKRCVYGSTNPSCCINVREQNSTETAFKTEAHSVRSYWNSLQDRGTQAYVASPRPIRNGAQPQLETATRKSQVQCISKLNQF